MGLRSTIEKADKWLNQKSFVDDDQIIALEDLTKSHWGFFDNIMKLWRGPHPYEDRDVGYWVIKGWYKIPDVRAKSEYSLLQKKRYAEIKLKEWFYAIKTGELDKEKVEAKEKDDFYELQIMIFEEDRVRAPKSEQELYEADIMQLSGGIREGFKTFGRDDHTPLLSLKGVAKKLGDFGYSMAMSVIDFGYQLGYNAIKATWRSGKFIVNKIRGQDGRGVFEAFVEGLNEYIFRGMIGQTFQLGKLVAKKYLYPILASFLAGYIGAYIPALGGALGIAGIVCALIWATQKLMAKNRKNYIFTELLVSSGISTPEQIEKEYHKKLDKIMDDESLDWREMKQKMLDLHEEFQTVVQPSIEKGLLHGYLGEDLSFEDLALKSDQPEFINRAFLWFATKIKDGVSFAKGKLSKTSSDLKTPFGVRLAQNIENLSFVEEAENLVSSGKFDSILYNVYTGKEKVDPELAEIAQEPELIKAVKMHMKPLESANA